MPVAGDEIVQAIAERRRNEIPEQQHAPHAAEIAGKMQRGGGTVEDSFAIRAGGLDPEHRIDCREFGMPGADLGAETSLKWSKAGKTAAIVPEHQLDALGAEAALSVVEKNGSVAHGLSAYDLFGARVSLRRFVAAVIFLLVRPPDLGLRDDAVAAQTDEVGDARPAS